MESESRDGEVGKIEKKGRSTTQAKDRIETEEQKRS